MVYYLLRSIFLRREKNKRFYFREFNSIGFFAYVKLAYSRIVLDLKNINPNNQPISQKITSKSVYKFTQYPNYTIWFKSISQNIDLIKKGLNESLHKSVVKSLDNTPDPFIAIHIRMGDFRKVETEEEYMNTWVARTPLTYFITTINLLRKELNAEVPVLIFSDGHASELEEISSLPNVKLHQSEKDIADILIMSKAKILLTSQGSSFSYWATVLSENIIIHHFKDDSQIRPADFNKKMFEGHLCKTNNEITLPDLLKNNLSVLTTN